MDSLYAVKNAVSVLCRSCQRPIDVWLFHGVRFSRKGAFHDPAGRALCLECLWNTFSHEERELQRQNFVGHQKLAQEAGIPPTVTTYVFGPHGTPGTWTEGFQAAGYAVHVRGAEGVFSDRQPLVTITPHNPVEEPATLVFFAGVVEHCDVKLAYLKFIWPFHDLSLPERFEIVNGMDPEVRHSDLTKLLHGRRFWRGAIGRGGRPSGVTTWTREEFLSELPIAQATFEQRHGRKPFDTELATELGMSKSSYTRYKRRFLAN